MDVVLVTSGPVEQQPSPEALGCIEGGTACMSPVQACDQLSKAGEAAGMARVFSK